MPRVCQATQVKSQAGPSCPCWWTCDRMAAGQRHGGRLRCRWFLIGMGERQVYGILSSVRVASLVQSSKIKTNCAPGRAEPTEARRRSVPGCCILDVLALCSSLRPSRDENANVESTTRVSIPANERCRRLLASTPQALKPSHRDVFYQCGGSSHLVPLTHRCER